MHVPSIVARRQTQHVELRKWRGAGAALIAEYHVLSGTTDRSALGSQKPAAAPARAVWRVLVRYVPATGSRHQCKRFVPWIQRLHA